MPETETQAEHAQAPRAGSVTGQPLWLDLDPEPVYAVLHAPLDPVPSRVAALIMPTFGWDNDWSYRPRRAWATALAEGGITALRLDFPGTEDSVGSPLLPDRVRSWVDATVSAAAWLRERSGCERLVVVGVGLGGLIAYEAIAAGAAIDDLVLWGVRDSGRAYMRELRTFAASGQAPADAERDQARADGLIGIGGHRMSVATAEAVGAIKLPDTPLPDAQLRRVLLIGRDAHGVDKNLQQHLEQSGAEVTVIEADDYKSLMARAELQLVPSVTISASIEWMLDQASMRLAPIRHQQRLDVPKAVDSVTFEHNGVSVRESLAELMTSAGRVLGIVSEPVSNERVPYCLILTNAGTLRRTGPGRLSVGIARNAAASGIPAARFDLPGLGDSDGAVTKTYERTPADDEAVLGVIAEIYDHLQHLGVAEQFVPAGLCLGGYFAVRMVPQDARSIGAIGLNSPTLEWSDTHSRTVLRTVTAEMGAALVGQPEHPKAPTAAERLRDRVGQRRHAIEQAARARLASVNLLWRPAHRAELASATEAIDRLGRVGVPVFFELCDREPLVHVFAQPQVERRLSGFPQIRIERLATTDHDLRPLWVQDVVFERVSRMLDELRSRTDGDVPSSVTQQAPAAADVASLGNKPFAADE